MIYNKEMNLEEDCEEKTPLNDNYYLEMIVHSHLKPSWPHLYINEELISSWRSISDYRKVHLYIMDFIGKNEEFKGVILHLNRGSIPKTLFKGSDLTYKTKKKDQIV